MHTTRYVVLRRTPCLAVTVAGAILLLGHEARAQTEITVGPFIAAIPSAYDAHATRLTGLALGAYSGAFGARASGALALDATTRSSSGARVSTISDWIADGDVLLRVGGFDRYHSVAPDIAIFGFLGVGAVAWRDGVDSMHIAQSWSHGGGLSIGLGESIQLTGEARYRRPLDLYQNSEQPFAPRMEYRAGISLRFGGASARGARHSTVRTGGRGAVIIAPPTPSGGSAIPVPYPADARLGARVIPTAESYLGTPYRYGGDTPATGFDCSGFVRYVYAKNGVSLPRTSRAMAKSGTRLTADFSKLKAGDLVMFAEKGEAISHVAVYAGGDRIIHASSSAGRVRYDDLDSERGQWFRRRIVAARRVPPDARGLMADLTASLLQDEVKGLTFDAGDRAPTP